MGLMRRFWSLSGPDRRLALEAAMAIALTRTGLWIAGYNACIALAARFSGNKANSRFHKHPAERVATMLNATARHLPFHPTCLEQSIALWWMLRRRSYEAQLRLGGRLEEDQFEAHAWIERGGIVLNDAAGEYLTFSSFQKTDPGSEAR